MQTHLRQSLLFCSFLFSFGYASNGIIHFDTVTAYYTNNTTKYLETKPILTNQELEQILIATNYDSTKSIKKYQKTDITNFTLFCFIGWPCTLNVVSNKSTSIEIKFTEIRRPSDDDDLGAPPAPVVVVYAIPKSELPLNFINMTPVKVQNIPNFSKTFKPEFTLQKHSNLLGRQLTKTVGANSIQINTEDKVRKNIYFKNN
jgi:hypothetical protein